MSMWPVRDVNRYERVLAGCSSAAAHTKGAWFTHHAALPFDVHSINLGVGIVGTDYANTYSLTDIGVGAAGSEVVLIPNLMMSQVCSTTRPLPGYRLPRAVLPCYIPAGTRVAIRHQHTLSVSRSTTLDLLYVGGGFKGARGIQAWEAYGPNTATSRAVGIVLPTTAGVWSAWSTLGTTVRRIRHLLFSVSPDEVSADTSLSLEYGTGAAGFESMFFTRGFIFRPAGTLSNHQAQNYHFIGPIPVNFLPGTRIAVRARFNGGATLASAIHFSAYGGA